MDVALIRWPTERQRRDRLQEDHLPRLLLVEDGRLPAVDDCLEDWIRVPADEAELAQRVATLRARANVHGVDGDPALDEDGVLRLGPLWVSLPPVEARLTAALLERVGAVVSREALARAGWPAGAPGRNALDVHVLRLRRRLEVVGLAIRTVRSRGYLLERASDFRQASVNPA